MSNIVAWSLFILGILHIVFGLVKYKTPLAEAVKAGVIGQFSEPEVRRTAFWFLMVGPFLMLSGYTAIHAVAFADLALLRTIGASIFVTSMVGVIAFPKSPLWMSLIISLLLIVAG